MTRKVSIYWKDATGATHARIYFAETDFEALDAWRADGHADIDSLVEVNSRDCPRDAD